MQHLSDYATLISANEVIKFAEQLPIDILTARNSEPKYPVTASERLVSYILDLLLSKNWQDAHSKAIVTDIEGILSQLDTGVDAPQEWATLFEANAQLSKYLQSKNSH